MRILIIRLTVGGRIKLRSLITIFILLLLMAIEPTPFVLDFTEMASILGRALELVLILSRLTEHKLSELLALNLTVNLIGELANVLA